MSTVFTKHRVEVQRTREPIYEKGRPTGGVLANLYSTDSYTVLNVGLPRCRPEHIKVTLVSNAILVVAELHQAQEILEKERNLPWLSCRMGLFAGCFRYQMLISNHTQQKLIFETAY